MRRALRRLDGVAVRLSDTQYENLETFSRGRYERELAAWLRDTRTAYVDDLTDKQLLQVAKSVCAQCDALKLFGEDATRAFGAAATVYGVYSYNDPLFQDIYYAHLPRSGAQLRHGPKGIWDALAKVLTAEFCERDGNALIVSLGHAFCGETYPDMTPDEVLASYFPERHARLSQAQIAAHVAHSDFQASRLGLTQPMAHRFHRDVALLLGAHFSIDPLYPWAITAFQHTGDDMAKISRLRAALTVIVRKSEKTLEGAS